MADDPWDCFGDDSSTEDIQEDKDHAENRLRLINKANDTTSSNSTQKEQNDKIPTQDESNSFNYYNDPRNDDNEDIDLPPTLIMWENRPPLYMGPMAVVKDPTSNRGYIATENLRPGTLLLVEEPIFRWPIEQIGTELGLSSIQAILNNDYAQDIVDDMEFLYPTRNDVDSVCRNGNQAADMDPNQKIQIYDMINVLTMQYHGDKHLERILTAAKKNKISKSRENSDDVELLDDTDIFRMLLTLRYNGFDSGLYLHFAMFNHSCDANCIKFMPENELNGNDNRKYSEVRTTKFIKKGEILTLHYLNPREVSHATRRFHIWDQHRFDIGSGMINHSKQVQEMDFVNGVLPVSSRDRQDDERTTFLVEKSLKDLQNLYRDLNIASKNKLSSDESIEMFEHCKALEIATEEMIHASSTKLNNKQHLLLIRCCRLHLDSSEMLLRVGTAELPSISLTNKQQLEIMKKFVRTCHTLLSLQTQYLGRDHPDVARSRYDLAMGINSLLSRSPKTLYSLNLTGLNSFNGCQRFEGECRKDHHRIDFMYPRDVEEKIKNRNL